MHGRSPARCGCCTGRGEGREGGSKRPFPADCVAHRTYEMYFVVCNHINPAGNKPFREKKIARFPEMGYTDIRDTLRAGFSEDKGGNHAYHEV